MPPENAFDSKWLRRYHPAPRAATRLICFPHAGGSASFYRPVSADLAPLIDVFAVQYPGRQDRRSEPVIDNVMRLAGEISCHIGKILDRPFAFYGHSMGALVAFEVARLLKDSPGRSPSVLFVSGRRAPSTYRHETVHLRDDAGLIAEIRELSGTDSILLEDEAIVRMMLPAVRGDYKAVETYQATSERLACPVMVFAGESDPLTTLGEAAAWQDNTTDAAEVQVFPGGHFFIVEWQNEITAVMRKRLMAK